MIESPDIILHEFIYFFPIIPEAIHDEPIIVHLLA
jgi:hypothetical protein